MSGVCLVKSFGTVSSLWHYSKFGRTTKNNNVCKGGQQNYSNCTDLSKLNINTISCTRKKKAKHFVVTLNAQPSTGCASSIYTTAKSAASKNSLVSCWNFCSICMNTGQVELPKLSTSGRLPFAKSKSLWQRFPSIDTTGELYALLCSLTFLFMSASRQW